MFSCLLDLSCVGCCRLFKEGKKEKDVVSAFVSQIRKKGKNAKKNTIRYVSETICIFDLKHAQLKIKKKDFRI